jgi:hypothetical protein
MINRLQIECFIVRLYCFFMGVYPLSIRESVIRLGGMAFGHVPQSYRL